MNPAEQLADALIRLGQLEERVIRLPTRPGGQIIQLSDHLEMVRTGAAAWEMRQTAEK